MAYCAAIYCQGPCSFAHGAYQASWRVDGIDIVFEVEEATETGRWTGIGFGSNMASALLQLFFLNNPSNRPTWTL